MRAKPLSKALPAAAANTDLCHNWNKAEIADIFHRGLPVADLHMKMEFTAGANRPPKVSQGRAQLKFLLTCGVAGNEIVRVERCADTWRDNACRSTAAGRA
jgi:hypothetical protein